MTIRFLYKISLLCAALVMLACSSESPYVYEGTPFLPETPPIVEDFCTFVSTEQAGSVAQAFLGRHTDVGISTRMAGEEPTITTVYERGEPKMHIVINLALIYRHFFVSLQYEKDRFSYGFGV